MQNNHKMGPYLERKSNKLRVPVATWIKCKAIFAEWDKPDKKDFIVHNIIYIKLARKGKFIEA